MKRFISVLLVSLILQISLTPLTQALSLLPENSNNNTSLGEEVFLDVFIETPNGPAIKELRQEKIINGYEDGSFKPSRTINRAEFVTLVINSLGKETSGTNCFPDVKEEWFAEAVCSAKAWGIVDGYANGMFDPGRNINLVEASKIIANATELQLEEGGEWYTPFIKALSSRNAVPSSIDRLTNKITRGEVAEILNRIRNNDSSQPSKDLTALTSGVPTIGSCEELDEKIRNAQYKNGLWKEYYYDSKEGEDFSLAEPPNTSASPDPQSVAAPKSTSATSESAGSDDYSQTNIQVENVDESDLVKNNGSHIFFVNNGNVKIIKAYPASDLKEESTIDLPGSAEAESIFLNANQLIVLGSTYEIGRSQTTVHIYDISNPANPTILRTLRLDGSSISSRRINNNLYLVLNQYQRFNPYNQTYGTKSEEIEDMNSTLPQYYDSISGKYQKLARCHEIKYFPAHKTINYLIVAGIPLNDTNKSISRDVMIGASEDIYASTENLYVANTEYNYDDYMIFDSWDTPDNASYTNTRIHQFGLNNGQVEYKQSGLVKGTILNQFAMDEYKDSFRIATTSDSWPQDNNLYILNKNNLEETQGKIEKIAPGETIHSVRFQGDRTYMVTFQKIDPFFVIDTSDPYNPTILGKLKIPGFSNYLHPYDENHVIGIGKDATPDPKGDFSWYQGLKVALFDVRDVAHPKEISQVIIGHRGSESPALNNHRAILFSKEKGFLAFPLSISEHAEDSTDIKPSTRGEFTFQGAHVYNINTRDGISLRGAITHLNEQDLLKAGSYGYYGNKAIERIIYIGDNFYTISKAMIKANNIETIKETNSLEILEDESDIEPIPWLPIPIPFFQ